MVLQLQWSEGAMVYLRQECTIEGIHEDAYRKQWYAAFLDILHDILPKPYHSTLTVILVDDLTIKKLNKEHRGMDKVTDVLSFYYSPERADEQGEGELFISLPQALRQSRRYKTSFKKEMARLVIHGILHLEGYDHMKTHERRVMRGYERLAIDRAKKEKLI